MHGMTEVVLTEFNGMIDILKHDEDVVVLRGDAIQQFMLNLRGLSGISLEDNKLVSMPPRTEAELKEHANTLKEIRATNRDENNLYPDHPCYSHHMVGRDFEYVPKIPQYDPLEVGQ